MADPDIDFERVITDPVYRRKVIEQLKDETVEVADRATASNVQPLRKKTPCSAA